MRAAVLALVCALPLLACGCHAVKGSGTSKTEVRTVSTFDALDVSGGYDVDLTIDPSAAQEVSVQGDDNLLPYVETVVEGTHLRVRTKSSTSLSPFPSVHVRAKALHALSLSGATHVHVTGVDEDKLSIHASGKADVTASGRADALDLDVSGATALHLASLSAKNVKVSASGASSLEVHASDSVTGNASGATHVRYRGAKPTLTTSGTASIEAM